MFLFDFTQLTINNDGVDIVSLSPKLIPYEIQNLLDKYEIKVFDELSKKYDFKYVQSTVKGFTLFNDLKSCLPQNYHIEMMTRHPSFMGGIILHNLIPQQLDDKDTFVLFFKSPIDESWLNSQINLENLVDELKQFLICGMLNKEIKFNVIEIYDSSLLTFTQSQLGSKSKRWKIKK